MMHEVFFLIGDGARILHRDDGPNAGALPDSRARWEAIWTNRELVEEVAHSHPAGPLAFSHEDETTMQALEAALGKPLRFSIVAPGGMIARQNGKDERVEREPPWAAELRRASGMGASE